MFTDKSYSALALGAALLLGPMSASWANGVPVGPSAAPSALEGTWDVTITPYVCATGAPLTAAAFRSRLSFMRGGAMVETPFNSSFQPGQRSPGLGFWERTGPNDYRAVFEAFIYFTSPTVAPTPPRYTKGHQRVEQSVEMLDADHWTSTAQVTFADEAGSPLMSGCFTAEAQRQD